ncbi:hypothetical protein CYPRO_2770 [Cyclonatronum proteinivorum]|uniref:Uncharacterized protein n=1 Tax=Cyclonatronum proteinivorum TaxID=1457365 RepID=A0A345UNF7_9BACT|nr:hypothetical protein [Cyclonatronum proteinivorum]AXJ02009.1 hypothetical protein CYPRO_2770 [Cyclonatronum proteinivorum]
MQQFYTQFSEAQPGKKFTNGLVALFTGALSMIFPDLLHIIIAAWLISNAIMQFLQRPGFFVGFVSFVAGVFVYQFENFIPYAFAFVLIVMAFGAILSGGISFFGIITFVFALLITGTPALANIMIGAFLVFYGSTSLYTWWQFRKLRKQL